MQTLAQGGSLQEQADADLARRSVAGIRAHIGIVIVVLATTTLYREAPLLIGSLIGGFFVQVLIRAGLVAFKGRIYPIHPRFWRNSIYACALAGAALLGVISAFSIVRFGYQHQNSFFVACCVVSLCAGSVNTLIANARISTVYQLLSLGPGLVMDAVHGGVAGCSLFGGTLMLCLYFAEQGRQMNREYWQGLKNHQELHIRTRELHVLAHQDGLTGLPNRRQLTKRLSAITKNSDSAFPPMGLLFIDLDRFKQVNDTFSHRVGDLYLTAVGKRIAERLHAGEMLARVGGDEFLILLEDLSDPSVAFDRARAVLDSLRNPITVEGHELPVSASIGVSLCPEHGTELETLQKHADLAMYSSKRLGRAQFQVYDPQMSAKYGRVATIEKELRRALAGTGLSLHYQPQFDSFGRIVGLEALARFTAEGLGPVAPGEFIGVAEETGLIRGVGRWVLYEACRQAAEWRNLHIPLARIAVNVSAAQITESCFTDDVKDVLRKTGLDPNCLELELTESLFMHDLHQVAEHMSSLRSMGVRFSIDDFGAGYSSLSYLHKLPIDAVKIDRCFVNDLAETAGNSAIIETILMLARSLHIGVIAEGVETSQQFSALQNLGCAEFQGYLFAKPLPAEQIPSLMSAVPKTVFADNLPETIASNDLAKVASGRLSFSHSAKGSGSN